MSPDSNEESSVGTDDEESVLTDRRGKPVPPDRIYLGEVSQYRPIATGDIFEVDRPHGLIVDGECTMIMVTSHPSGMRRGAELEEYVRAAPVVIDTRLSPRKANTKIIDLFPLPLLEQHTHGADRLSSGPWGVRVDLTAPVRSEILQVQRRCGCLAPYGMALLCQCIGYSDTRVMVREDMIEGELAPKLQEIEWLENWNEDLVAPRVNSGSDLQTELAAAAIEFEAVMTQDRGEGRTLQSMLKDLNGLPAVEAERIMAAELRSRRT